MNTSAPELNKLLATLPDEERARLLALGRIVAFERGQPLGLAGDRVEYLDFPLTLVAALMVTGRSGATTALAMVGPEGAMGLAEVLAGEALAHDAVALLPGEALRLGSNHAARILAPGSTLLAAALNHNHSLTAQIAQTAFCNLHHSLEQRLCRWLLSIAYRTTEHALHLTEAQIADILGVRRESVSQATVRLREEGLISHQRGMIHILDRDSLEAKACECLPVFPWHAYPRRCPLTPAAGNLP